MQLNNNQNSPEYQTGIIIFLIFVLIFAGYIILGNHSKAFGQDCHDTCEANTNNHNAAMEGLYENHNNHDPLHGAVGDSEIKDPTEGKVFESIPPNPYMEEDFSEEDWKVHYEYQYYLWLEYKPLSAIDLELKQREKEQVQSKLRDAVYRHLFHCIRRKDKTGALARHCANAPGGCQQHVDLLTTYIVDVAYDLNLDPWMMAAVALNESGFNPYAVGKARKERGYFQINPLTPLGRKTKFVRYQWYRNSCKRKLGQCQREVAKAAGIHLYRDFKKCGTMERALTAYNTGRCSINGQPRWKYVNKVKKKMKTLKIGYVAVPWCDGKNKSKAVPMFSLNE